MKANALKWILALFLVALLPVSLLLTGLAMPDYYADSYYAELAPMANRLQAAEGRKLIVLGNSDVAFGLDGALMEHLLSEKGYDYTVYPFGLYAAVGINAMLELSRDALHEGDLVILIVEPVSETLSSYFGANAFLKCAEGAPELLLHTNNSQRAALVGNYTAYLQERFAYYKDGSAPTIQGVYAKSSFNDRCDMVFERSGNTMPIGFDTAESINFSALSVEEAFAEQVKDYCSAASEVGASVCISFSPMNRSAIADASSDALDGYFTLINGAFPCPAISDPSRYVLDSGWFYDSNFHLNSAGAELRTVMLAEDVLAYLGCYQAVAYDFPPMPAPIAVQAESTGDAADFTYTSIGDGAGWLIAGLTEQGQSKTALTVPASYEGKPIVGFLPDALFQANNLEALTLPTSIETLPDFLFSSCNRLDCLILLHTELPCGVSSHSLDGADQLRIFVPAAAYPLYRDGYGCETSPWTPFLDRFVLY